MGEMSKPTNEELNKRIAEFEGWKFVEHKPQVNTSIWISPDGKAGFYHPDYTLDSSLPELMRVVYKIPNFGFLELSVRTDGATRARIISLSGVFMGAEAADTPALAIARAVYEVLGKETELE